MPVPYESTPEPRCAGGFIIYVALRGLSRHGLIEMVESSCRQARHMAELFQAIPGAEIFSEAHEFGSQFLRKDYACQTPAILVPQNLHFPLDTFMLRMANISRSMIAFLQPGQKVVSPSAISGALPI